MTPKDEARELKECQCGSKARVHKYKFSGNVCYKAVCLDDDCPFSLFYPTEELARKAWNTRSDFQERNRPQKENVNMAPGMENLAKNEGYFTLSPVKFLEKGQEKPSRTLKKENDMDDLEKLARELKQECSSEVAWSRSPQVYYDWIKLARYVQRLLLESRIDEARYHQGLDMNMERIEVLKSQLKELKG